MRVTKKMWEDEVLVNSTRTETRLRDLEANQGASFGEAFIAGLLAVIVVSGIASGIGLMTGHWLPWLR